jgi:hypothetical protein
MFRFSLSPALLDSLHKGDLPGIFKSWRSSLLRSVVSCLHPSTAAESDAFSSAEDIASCVAVMSVVLYAVGFEPDGPDSLRSLAQEFLKLVQVAPPVLRPKVLAAAFSSFQQVFDSAGQRFRQAMDAQPSARWSPSFVSDEWHKTELAELQKFIETTATAARMGLHISPLTPGPPEATAPRLPATAEPHIARNKRQKTGGAGTRQQNRPASPAAGPDNGPPSAFTTAPASAVVDNIELTVPANFRIGKVFKEDEVFLYRALRSGILRQPKKGLRDLLGPTACLHFQGSNQRNAQDLCDRPSVQGHLSPSDSAHLRDDSISRAQLFKLGTLFRFNS